MANSDDDLVLSRREGPVAVITFNNPERRNGWSPPMEDRYFALLDEADRDADVRAIVVTGAGTTFCPGLDAERLAATARSGSGVDFAARRPQSHPTSIRKPLIAAINGGCAGVGLMQALYCDIRFAADTARLSTAYARRGLPAEYGMSWVLPRLIGVEKALDLLLSGRVFDAHEALALGVVSRVVPADELLDAAVAYADDLARNCSPLAMAAIKRQVYGDLDRRYPDAAVHALGLMREFGREPDFVEGVTSFRERRPPQFPGLDPSRKFDTELGYAI